MNGRHLWKTCPSWLRRTLIVAAGLLAAIVLLTNLVLWLGVVPRLLNADSAALSYRLAWAPWPTHLKVKDLMITGQDPNVQFAIGVDDAWLTLDLIGTFRERTIKITRLRGSGASVRLLQRLQPWAVTDQKVRALPDIPGRTKPPLTHAHVPGPPATREGYDQISIEVNDVDAMARELWIDEVRYQGDIHVIGSFLLRPGLELRIGPVAEAHIQSGTLTVAGQPIFRDMKGTADCQAASFNPVAPPGPMILHYFSGSLVLAASLVNAEFVNYFLDAPDVAVRGGAGRFDMALGFDHGVLRPSTKLEVSSSDLQIELAKTRIRTSLALNATVHANQHATVQGTTTQLSVGPLGQGERLSGGELIASAATLAAVDLSQPLPSTRYSAQLSRLSGDLGVVQAYLPPEAPVVLDGGQLGLQGEVSGTSDQPDLGVQLRVDSEFKAHDEQRRFAGKLVVFGNAKENSEGFELAGTKLNVADLMVAREKDVIYGWWTHAEVASGGYVPGASPRLSLQLQGGLRDIQPLYVAAGSEIGIPGWLQGLLPLPGTTWRGHLEAEAGAVRLSNFRAESGAVHARIKLKKPRDTEPSGAILVTSGPLSFGVAFLPGQSGSELLATDAWFERQQ